MALAFDNGSFNGLARNRRSGVSDNSDHRSALSEIHQDCDYNQQTEQEH
jgi:hypothetical protein